MSFYNGIYISSRTLQKCFAPSPAPIFFVLLLEKGKENHQIKPGLVFGVQETVLLVNHALARGTPAIFVIFVVSRGSSSKTLVLLVRMQIRHFRHFRQKSSFSGGTRARFTKSTVFGTPMFVLSNPWERRGKTFKKRTAIPCQKIRVQLTGGNKRAQGDKHISITARKEGFLAPPTVHLLCMCSLLVKSVFSPQKKQSVLGIILFLLGQKSCRTKVPRIFRIFVPNFPPNFAPNFPGEPEFFDGFSCFVSWEKETR